MTPITLWGGVECTVNRVGDNYHDQLRRSGHADRVEDIDRFASLGVTSLRYPVLWERVAPCQEEGPDWSWPDARLERIRAVGMNPIVGLLHHGSGPPYTSLLDPQFSELLAAYAGHVATRYPWVIDWTPVNEPLTTARFSALYGLWYPHMCDDAAFVAALLNQLRGTVLAMERIRAVNPRARLVQTEDLGRTFGTRRLRRQVAFESHRRWLTWDLLCGRVDRTHAMYQWLRQHGAAEQDLAFFIERPCPPDIVGVNYYLTSDRWLDERIELYPPERAGGNGLLTYADVEAVRARPRGIEGHEHQLIAAWERYQRPVALTEVHLGCTREQQVRWLVEAWRGAHRARERGADVRGVTAWALLGSYDWDSLVTQQNGHYEPGLFDVRGGTPRLTAVGEVARDLSGGREPGHPAATNIGWWRRPARLLWGSEASPSVDPPLTGPPLLIVGGRGTLGSAFRRLCSQRGMAAYAVARAELDLCDAPRIDALLRRVKPWAVVNAAGYVRVDEAEHDRERCWRDNVYGAANLAAACRRRRLPLVTFSSDLVFDGTNPRPYVEDATPTPLNVYGASKAEAERRVLDLLPNALVVRTGAFFGPWDEYNFATVARRTLASGQIFQAAGDYVVSPTYVPDLVNAVLDLLIDGACGVWHLVNEGAVTWFEFAERVLRAAGSETALLQRCPTRDVWQPALRPPHSVLGSARGQLLRPLESAIAAYIQDIAAAECHAVTGLASS